MAATERQHISTHRHDQESGSDTAQTSDPCADQTVDEVYNVLLGTGSNSIPYVPIDIRSLFCVKTLKGKDRDISSSHIHQSRSIKANTKQPSSINKRTNKKSKDRTTRLYPDRNDNRSCYCKGNLDKKDRKIQLDNFDSTKNNPCDTIPEALQNDCAEVCRVVFDNIWISRTNAELKMKLKKLREQHFAECARILDFVFTFCEARAEKKRGNNPCRPRFPVTPVSTRIKLSDGHGDAGDGNFRPSTRILGELAFQLERRVLGYILGKEAPRQCQVYGYTVANVCRALEGQCTGARLNEPQGAELRADMKCRMNKIMCALKPYGYDSAVHADFSEKMVNKYGLLPAPPTEYTVRQFGLDDACALSRLVSRITRSQSEQRDLHVLLNCLNFLSDCDGKPLLVW